MTRGKLVKPWNEEQLALLLASYLPEGGLIIIIINTRPFGGIGP